MRSTTPLISSKSATHCLGTANSRAASDAALYSRTVLPELHSGPAAGRPVHFPTLAAPTDSSQFCKTGSRNVDRILLDLTAPEGQSIGHCQNRSEGTLQGQQLCLGVEAQKICANDNVKGVGVKQFAVLRVMIQAFSHSQA